MFMSDALFSLHDEPYLVPIVLFTSLHRLLFVVFDMGFLLRQRGGAAVDTGVKCICVCCHFTQK